MVLGCIYAKNRLRETLQLAGQGSVCEVCMFSTCLRGLFLKVLLHPPTFKDKHGSFNWLLLSKCGRECLFVAPCD